MRAEIHINSSNPLYHPLVSAHSLLQIVIRTYPSGCNNGIGIRRC